jgi:hypothetical protein
MDAPPRRWFEPASRLLLEAALIVLSVVLGFAVTEWRQNRADRELVAHVLQNVRTEVELNLAQIEQQLSRHQQMIKMFEAADTSDPEKSAWDVALGIMMKMGGGMDTLPLRQAAWDAAVSSGALRLMDYDLTAVLSEIYVGQHDAYTTTVLQAVPAIFTTDTFRPGSQREALQVIRWLMVEVEGRERFVRDLYKRHLPRLQAQG